MLSVKRLTQNEHQGTWICLHLPNLYFPKSRKKSYSSSTLHMYQINSSVPIPANSYFYLSQIWIKVTQNWGIPWRSRGQDPALSLLRMRVQSLVGELRSHKPWGAAHPPQQQQQKDNTKLITPFLQISSTTSKNSLAESVTSKHTPIQRSHNPLLDIHARKISTKRRV